MSYKYCAGGCGELLRPRGEKLADHPGTVLEAVASMGLCTKCARGRRDIQKRGRGRPRKVPPPPVLRELSDQEKRVVEIVESRSVGDERDRLIAMLGLTGYEAPMSLLSFSFLAAEVFRSPTPDFDSPDFEEYADAV